VLHAACYAGRSEIAKFMVLHWPALPLDVQNIFSDTPLHAACTSGSIHLVSFLLEQPGVRVDVRGADGRTPLHSACVAGSAACVQLLLSKGADVSSRCNDEAKSTCFMWAYDLGYFHNLFLSFFSLSHALSTQKNHLVSCLFFLMFVVGGNLGSRTRSGA
jgi:serine/threonine-protein kinase TNNI3K